MTPPLPARKPDRWRRNLGIILDGRHAAILIQNSFLGCGLVYVDYATRQRTIMGSGHRYADIIGSHRTRARVMPGG